MANSTVKVIDEKVKLSSSFRVFQKYLYSRAKEGLQKRGWNSNSSKLIRDPPASYEAKDFQLQARVRPVLSEGLLIRGQKSPPDAPAYLAPVPLEMTANSTSEDMVKLERQGLTKENACCCFTKHDSRAAWRQGSCSLMRVAGGLASKSPPEHAQKRHKSSLRSTKPFNKPARVRSIKIGLARMN